MLAIDLYTFDADSSSAQATFSEVCESYVRIFTRLGLPFVQGVVILWHMLKFFLIVVYCIYMKYNRFIVSDITITIKPLVECMHCAEARR